MTQEQYNRAVEISENLKNSRISKKELREAHILHTFHILMKNGLAKGLSWRISRTLSTATAR